MKRFPLGNNAVDHHSGPKTPTTERRLSKKQLNSIAKRGESSGIGGTPGCGLTLLQRTGSTDRVEVKRLTPHRGLVS